jgi:hypothetical protein
VRIKCFAAPVRFLHVSCSNGHFPSPSPAAILKMACPKLDALPVEILRQIVISGPFESLFNLRDTNRSLRDACNDWTLFSQLSECDAKYSSDTSKCRCSKALKSSRMRRWTNLDLSTLNAFFGSHLIGPEATVDPARWIPVLTAEHRKCPIYHEIRSY